MLRWDGAHPGRPLGGTMPRFASVLLAIVVVTVLTVGLHVLFR